MSSENKEKFRIEYQAGKAAFEGGEYRLAVQRLESACALIPQNSRLGGEAQIWLVTAYEAAGQNQEAIALCQNLTRHPDPETSKQGKRLLYILKAPQLKRPAEWMTEIPDLGSLEEGAAKDRRGTTGIGTKKPQRDLAELEPIDLTQVNTKDNQFIWIALLVIVLTLAGLLWLS